MRAPSARSPIWSNVVKQTSIMAKARTGGTRALKAQGQGLATVRVPINVPCEVVLTLETIPKEKRVSLALVVRDTAEKHIADRWPLFARPKRD